jgi:hypothetical protein
MGGIWLLWDRAGGADCGGIVEMIGEVTRELL